MSEKRELTVFVYQYGAQRALAFVLDVALIVGGSIANHRWGGGSAWIDAFMAIMGFMVVLAIAGAAVRDRFSGTSREAIEWLQKREDEA